jgi:hypothetical protein
MAVDFADEDSTQAQARGHAGNGTGPTARSADAPTMCPDTLRGITTLLDLCTPAPTDARGRRRRDGPTARVLLAGFRHSSTARWITAWSVPNDSTD